MTEHTPEAIKEKLETDNRWLIRGLVAIFQRQTEDEQRQDSTNHLNGVGFNGSDAPFLSVMARRAIDRTKVDPRNMEAVKKAIDGMGFSPRQLQCIRKAMKKYAGQLHKITKSRA